MMLKMMLKALTVFACIATVQGYRYEGSCGEYSDGGELVGELVPECMGTCCGQYIAASVCGAGTVRNDAKTGCVAAVTCGAGTKTGCVAASGCDCNHQENLISGNDGCCNSDNKCGVNEGDCDSDSDCESGLECGHNNCFWGDNDDCCKVKTSELTSGVDDVTALEGNALVGQTASGAAGAGGDGGCNDVTWAQSMIAVSALLFVVGHLGAFLLTHGRPQPPGIPFRAAEDDEGDGEDAEDGSGQALESEL